MDLFAINELVMMGVVAFSSTFIFLFNYRQDNKDKYQGNISLIVFDWVINLGMAVTGYLLISIVFSNQVLNSLSSSGLIETIKPLIPF